MLTATRHMARHAGVRGLAPLRRGFLGDRRGSVFSELALVLPILVAILLGGVEVGRYLMIHQKLSRLIDTTTDLVAQKKTVSTQDLEDVLKSAQYVLEPFELGSDGIIFITSVTAPTSDTPKVDWQHSGAGSGSATSAIGYPGETPNLPSGFDLDDGENVIIGEIFFDYRPQIFEIFTSPKQIYYRVIDRPRFGPLTQLN